MPVLVPDGSLEFASNCTDLRSGVQNVTGKTPGRKRKETPRVLGVSEINAAFFNAYRSGETGIQTQGTREGTPVFRIGGCRRCNHASTQCPFGRCPAVQGDVLRTPQFDDHGLQTELGEFICLTAQTAFVAAQAAPATVQPVSMIDSVPTRERNCQSAPWLVE